MRKTILALAFTMVASSELFAGTLLWGFDGSALSNLKVAQITDAGTAAYSNTAAFMLSSAVPTWAQNATNVTAPILTNQVYATNVSGVANGFSYDIMAGAFVPTLSSGLYGGAQPLGGFYAMSLATANVAYYSIPARLFTSQRTNISTFSVMSTNNVGYGNSVTFTIYAFKSGGNYDSIDGGAATVTHSAGTNTWTLSRTNGTGTAWSGYSMIMAALYNGGTNRLWILEGKTASTP